MTVSAVSGAGVRQPQLQLVEPRAARSHRGRRRHALRRCVPLVTVSATVVVRVVEPDVAVIVTVAAPSVAVLDAVNVTVDGVAGGRRRRVERHGHAARQSGRASKRTAPVKFVRVIEIVDAAGGATRHGERAARTPTVKSLGVVPVTVSDTVVVRDERARRRGERDVAAPSVAVLEAVNVAVTELPVVAPSTG